MDPSFSVIIPAFNASAYIIKALDSIAEQTYAPEEIVVIDDGSVDKTVYLVKDWSSRHPEMPLKLIQQANCGVSIARNAGIRAASSSWVFLLDADDYFCASHVELLQRAIQHRSDLVVAFSMGCFFEVETDNGGTRTLDERQKQKALSASDETIAPRVYRLHERLFESLIPGNYIHPSCMCINRYAALNCGLFDESLRVSEDREFLLRLAKTGPFAFVSSATVNIRLHQDNASHPKNALRNTYFALLSLVKILRNKKTLLLTDLEVAAVESEIASTMNSYLYIASNRGVATFLEALQKVRQASLQFPMQSVPRHLVRAIRSSVLGVRKVKSLGAR